MEEILAKPLSFVGMRKTGLRKQLAQPSCARDTRIHTCLEKIPTFAALFYVYKQEVSGWYPFTARMDSYIPLSFLLRGILK